MCICGYYSWLYDNNSSNGWSFLIIFSSLLLRLLNFIKVHFFEKRKWKRCWFLEKSHSQGHDVVVEFIINVDFCNTQMKPSQIQNYHCFFSSLPSYTTCCWHCTMQSGQQFASMLERNKNTKHKNTQTTTTWDFLVCLLICYSCLLNFVTFKLVQKSIEIVRVMHGTINFSPYPNLCC